MFVVDTSLILTKVYVCIYLYTHCTIHRCLWTGPCTTTPPPPSFHFFYIFFLFVILTTPYVCLKSKNNRNITTWQHFIFTLAPLYLYKERGNESEYKMLQSRDFSVFFFRIETYIKGF